MWTRTGVEAGRRVIALDGKTAIGARSAQALPPHLVAAFDHTSSAVLGQVVVAAKSKEIRAVEDLLASIDLAGAVVTVDAMQTQSVSDTARAITGAGGDHVFTVKKNQPRLYTASKNLPLKDVPGHRVSTTGHGRRVTRTIKLVAAPAWVHFAGAAQVAQVRRAVTRGGTKTVEVVLPDHLRRQPLGATGHLAAWVQGHWGQGEPPQLAC